MQGLIDTAFAENSTQMSSSGVPTPLESMIENMFPLVFIFALTYFLFIRPQAKKAKEQVTLLEHLRAGDEIVTSGGIIGRVRSISQDFITIDTGGSQLKIVKEHVIRATKLTHESMAKRTRVAATAQK